MESIEKVHAVGTSFDIVWPTGRLYEGPRSVIAELVDRCDESSEVD